MVSLTDLFATCAEITGKALPENGAEDSISFLSAALKQSDNNGRTSLVSHSNHGEFAWRDGPWKLVFKKSVPNLNQSRDQPTIAELYHLDKDISEANDVSAEYPEVVKRMTQGLSMVIDRGASRPGVKGSNDTKVKFDTIQLKRWGPAGE